MLHNFKKSYGNLTGIILKKIVSSHYYYFLGGEWGLEVLKTHFINSEQYKSIVIWISSKIGNFVLLLFNTYKFRPFLFKDELLIKFIIMRI